MHSSASPPHSRPADESICELQSATLDAKNARKCAEADVQLLANRLAHLRQEEARAQKRIEEANRRAKEVEGLKKRNVEHQRAKQRMVEQMQRDIKQACEANSACRFLAAGAAPGIPDALLLLLQTWRLRSRASASSRTGR